MVLCLPRNRSNLASAPEVLFPPTEIRTRKGRTLKVRVYSFEDFGALVEMYNTFEPKRVAQGLPPPDVPRIAHWLGPLQNKSSALLALDGKKVVAHTILCPIPTGCVEFTVFVHQDYRQEGLGTMLSQLTLNWVYQMGFPRVFLATELSNFRALRLFRKLGFQIVSSDGDECEMKLDGSPSQGIQAQAA